MTPNDRETIVAIATPPGSGAIGIVRLSGPEAFRIAAAIFIPYARQSLSDFPSHTAHLGRLVDPDTAAVLDEAMALLLKAPRTYTREDMIEFSCHGGPLVLRRVLDSALHRGARLAEPGEFTRRAFLNGRIDLTQAEAVADIISAKTEAALRSGTAQLSGVLSARIRELREAVLSVLAEIETRIDFPDEDLPVLSRTALGEQLIPLLERITALLASADEGRILREGVTAVIAGRTNVGKSSLLNTLLEQDRALVSEYHGTTRDIIEEFANIGGFPVKLVDTAGLRPSSDPVESLGMERGRRSLATADLVLFVIDGSVGILPEDREIHALLKDKKGVLVANKSDLPSVVSREMTISAFPSLPLIAVSARTGAGLPELKQAVAAAVSGHPASPEHSLLTQVRHKQALISAEAALRRTLEGLHQNIPEECLSVDLKAALDALGSIVGETATEELLDSIFGRFCIGK